MKQVDGRCPDCGWEYGTAHICVDLSKPVRGEGVLPEAGRRTTAGRPLSEEHREKIAEGQRRRWANFRMEGS